MIGRLQLDGFVISETKLDSSFSSAQFLIGGYEITNCRDRDKSWSGLIEFFKKGIITNRLKDLETNIRKTIYTEITYLRKGGMYVSFPFFSFGFVCTDHHLPQTLILLTS